MEVEGKTTKTADYFKYIYKYVYLTGWPNFWHTTRHLPPAFIKYHKFSSIFFNVSVWFFILSELTGIFTQHDLSEKQKTDRMVFAISHPVVGTYGITLTYFQKNVRALTYSLTVELKKFYNDENVEKAMVKKARQHSIAFCIIVSSALVFYGLDATQKCLFDKDATFVTVVTAWPEVHDQSTIAGLYRIFAFILWWIFMVRVSGVYVMLISTFVCLGHQYKNLQSYFYNLDQIFENKELTHEEKEEKYEKGLKLGVNMHARTLWCTRECETSFTLVVSGQILVNVLLIILLMAQMINSERTFSSVAATLSTSTAMLISTGFFMWNAGDVAVEAEELATAMYSSGWHNCHGNTSVRVRKLLVIAMAQAQIVKASYSVFSVFY